MSNLLKDFDPSQLSVIVGGQIISGLADGESVKAEPNEDAVTLSIGSQGHGVRTHNANKSGKITLTLLHTSESNAVLQGFKVTDELSKNGTFPVLIRDNSGGDLITCSSGWIMKQASASFGKEATNKEWVIETHDLKVLLGAS
jgi:hypothetical protein